MDITEQEMLKLKYRFGGDRYSLRGPAHWGPSDIIPELPGLYAYAKPDSPVVAPPTSMVYNLSERSAKSKKA